MDWRELYREKLMPTEQAAGLIEPGDRIFVGGSGSVPVHLVDAVCGIESLHDVHIVASNGNAACKCVSDPSCFARVQYHTVFMGAKDREYVNEGNIALNSVHFHNVPQVARDVYHVNVLMVEVSEPDEEGYLYYGTRGVCWSPVADFVEKRIYQVNRYQQRVNGWHHRIHVSEVTALCRYDHPLAPYDYKTTAVDARIASNILPYIHDGDTIQIGIGGVPNAIAYGLTARKHLGIYTEVITDSMLYLMEQGVVDQDRVTAAFVLPSEGDVAEHLLRNIRLGPLDEVNDPYRIGQIPHLVSVNSCLMADVTGQACSESIGSRQYSGVGGQVDFIRGARMSPGGRSFLCLKSTYQKQDGTLVSNIHAALPEGAVVTALRTDVMYIVTEWGVAELTDRPFEDRIYAMINIAHPDFRQGLFAQSVERGLIRALAADISRVQLP